jgi:succinate-semialdehyde dehydrogenase/glutarate-semialdehyde dehydrogenase
MAESNQLRTQLYINAKWCEASDAGRFDVVDPATEQVLASVANATVADAAAAVDAAGGALAGWGALAPRARGEILRKAFELLDTQKEKFAEVITRENGKPLADSRAEVGYAAEFFRWYSEEAVRNIGQVSRAPSSGARILVQHKPAGVAVLITPWNFPVAMGTRKIAPALAAGCTVIVKPASETPVTMLLLAQLLQDAGVPAGVVNILPSRRSAAIVGSMLKDPRVRVVSFTGSTETGRALLGEAAKFVVNPRMELGGNAPFLIFEDADLEAAVAGAMTAKMRNMGEACTAANRIYVHDSIHDAFVTRFSAAMAALQVSPSVPWSTGELWRRSKAWSRRPVAGARES